jgi:predicted ester cyclase
MNDIKSPHGDYPPIIVFSFQEQVAEHDKFASRFEWTGTHRGEFLGIPATGRTVRVWGMVIDRLEGGRIKDTRIIRWCITRA